MSNMLIPGLHGGLLYPPVPWNNGLNALLPSFQLDLQHQLTPIRARIGTTPSYSRATTATSEDSQGKQVSVLSNEARMVGSRRVENLITASEDMTNGAYTQALGATRTSTQITYNGTTDGQVYQSVTITDDGGGVGARTFVFSVSVKVVSGTASSDSAMQLLLTGNAVTAATKDIGLSADGTERRFSISASTDAAGTILNPTVRWDDAGVLEVTKWQLEEVTGNITHAPSEYVSTGVGTGGELVEDYSASTWSAQGSNTVTDPESGVIRVTYVDNSNGAIYSFNDSAGALNTANLVDGKDYVITGDLRVNSGSTVTVNIFDGSSNNTITNANNTDWESFTYAFDVVDNSSASLRANAMGAGEWVEFRNLTLKEADHGLNRDGVKAFPYHNGNTPAIRKFLDLDGTGDYASTPNSSAIQITGDIDIRVKARLDDWTPATINSLIGRLENATSQRSYWFDVDSGAVDTAGKLIFTSSSDGTDSNLMQTASTAAVGFSNGTAHWVRVTVDVDNGASGRDVTFYTSEDGETWTQLGDVVTEATTDAIFAGTSILEVGSVIAGTAQNTAGQIFRAQVYSGISGTLAADFNAEDHTSGSTLTSSTTGEVWTFNADAFIDYEETGVVTEATGPAINSSTSQWVEFDGASGTYVSSPDSAANSPASVATFIAWIAPAAWVPSGGETIIGKWNTSGNQRSWWFNLQSNGRIGLSTSSDGTSGNITNSDSGVATGFADGTGHWVRATVDTDNNTADYYTSDDPIGTSVSTISWTQLGSQQAHSASGLYDGTADVEIGAIVNGVANLYSGKISRAVVIDSTDPTATPVVDFNANDYGAGKTFTSSSTGEIYTLNGTARVFSPFAAWGDFPGSSGDYFSSPDSAAADITGDLSLVAWYAADDWTPAAVQTIAGKYNATGNQRGYLLQLNTDGTINAVVSQTGGTAVASKSTVATGFSNGTGHWVGFSRDDSADSVSFYTSSDSCLTPINKITWCLLGEAGVASVSSGIANVTAPFEVGAHAGGTVSVASGKIARAAVFASTDLGAATAPSVDFDARIFTPGVTTATASTGEVWTQNGNCSIEQNIPSPWDASGPLGYLSEQAGTNDTPDNVALTTGYTYQFSSISANAIRSPSGKLDGLKLVEDSTASSVHRFYDIPSYSASQSIATSVYAKAGERSQIRISHNGLANVLFDLSDGTVSATTGSDLDNQFIEAVGDGWYRCTMISSTATTGQAMLIELADGGSTSYNGDGSSGVYLYGFQIEVGATFPTSLILTSGTATTRNADVLTYSAVGNADSFPMTVSAEVVPTTDDAQRHIVSIDDGTANNRAFLSVTAIQKFNTFVRDGGVTQADIDASDLYIKDVNYRIAAAWATNDVELYQESLSTGTPDTSASTTIPATTIHVGSDYGGASQPYGTIRKVKIFSPKRLNDSQVATL